MILSELVVADLFYHRIVNMDSFTIASSFYNAPLKLFIDILIVIKFYTNQ